MSGSLAKKIAEPAPSSGDPVLATRRTQNDTSVAAILTRMAADVGVSPMKLTREFAGLAFGPGRLSIHDYLKLRLYDDAFCAGADKRAFIGQRRNRDLNVEVNFRHDWLGLLSNKIASSAYLSAYGLPTIQAKGIFAPGLTQVRSHVMNRRAELRAFLDDDAIYPLFGKPVESFQSLGSIGFLRRSAKPGFLVGLDETEVDVEQFISDIEQNYQAGYVFQSFVRPHADILALCGPRLATARIVTIATADGPRIFRACWKIPSGRNVADNYWRAGNLLAKVDCMSGKIEHATSGTGFDLVEVDTHPDTGRPLVGEQIPLWDLMKETALEGARLMRHLSIIGWDMACADSGPLIVEMNENPDLFLNQLADRRGALDKDYLEFAAWQKKRSAAHAQSMRAEIAKL